MNKEFNGLSINLPNQQNYELAYGLACKLAVEKLSAIPEVKTLCQKSGSLLISDNNRKTIQLSYLNDLYSIKLPEAEINRATVRSRLNSETKYDFALSSYILRRALSGEQISFKDLREGPVYFPSFYQRAIRPLIDHFGAAPEKILKPAESLGGVKSDHGDVSVIIPAFARVPITLVLWKGDTEFPPNANILFDRTVPDYLPVEDLVVLCQTIVGKLVRDLPIISA
jgi:hypothetical protein